MGLVFMKISQSLVDGIDERLRKIGNSPDYFEKKAELEQEGLRHLGDLYSFWIEHPSLRSRLLQENGASGQSEVRDIARKGIKQIKRAWKYLNSDQFKEETHGNLVYLAPEVIQKVGKLVDTEKNHTGFRQGFVKSPFPNYTPQSAELVPGWIKKLCQDMRESSEHPVEIAAEIHMRLAGIQAFAEGNKRTARLYERRVLEGYGYPTAMIPFGERVHYLETLTKALDGLNRDDISAQTPFFNYIGGKVATALDQIIGDLDVE
jgi:Fic family protein